MLITVTQLLHPDLLRSVVVCCSVLQCHQLDACLPGVDKTKKEKKKHTNRHAHSPTHSQNTRTHFRAKRLEQSRRAMGRLRIVGSL